MFTGQPVAGNRQRIGLATEEAGIWRIHRPCDGRCRLLVDIGEHGNPELAPDGGRLNPRAIPPRERGTAGPVGLVEGGLEHIGEAESGTEFGHRAGDAPADVQGLDHAGTRNHHRRGSATNPYPGGQFECSYGRHRLGLSLIPQPAFHQSHIGRDIHPEGHAVRLQHVDACPMLQGT